MAVSQEVINRAHSCLKEINVMISNVTYNTKLFNQVFDKYKMQRGMMCYAVQVGVFSRVTPGVYKSNIKNIDPIHARQVIEALNKAQLASFKKRYSKLKAAKKEIPTEIKTSPSPKESPIEKPLPRVSVPKKSFSLFWGLFSFSQR